MRSEGCQGVKPNVRPALAYSEGSPLVVARAKLRVHSWPAAESLLILPPLSPGTAASEPS